MLYLLRLWSVCSPRCIVAPASAQNRDQQLRSRTHRMFLPNVVMGGLPTDLRTQSTSDESPPSGVGARCSFRPHGAVSRRRVETAPFTKQEQSCVRRAPATTLLLFRRSSRQERALSAARVAALGQTQSCRPRPSRHRNRASADSGTQENACRKGAPPMQCGWRLPADTAPAQTLRSGEAIARLGRLTIQIVAKL